MGTTDGHFRSCGNGLALRLSKSMAKAAGVTDGTAVRVRIEPGRIVIETDAELSLDQMLEAYDPRKHGGELTSDGPVGAEAFAC